MIDPRSVVIRRATADDAGALFHVRLGVTENATTREELAQIGLTLESVAAAIMASPCCWVAEREGEIVGFSMIDDAEACLFAAFVLPEMEGRGIGRALVARAEAALFRRHDAIWLETERASRAAGFYRRLGWREAEAVDERDVVMRKSRR
ncbi:GNAT family N-acetyltransferase [Aureimonas sp. ME7]|uniref:GNAT family N-acetyltransferase n=1 Tax=Aureimonas sp. ME7 TaxID=2744252 RepID=UPI0015F738B8|nr:GNAT family N-acetyltransferase [Aureimonas sp. ME7]